LIIAFAFICPKVNAQLKVNSTGTVNIGTGTGGIDATLNLYSNATSTVFSRAINLPSSGDAVKSTVYSSSANTFAGWNDNTKTFSVKGDGTVWSRLNAYTSDSTQKENFEDIDKPKENLLKLKGLTYNFKNSEDKSRKNIGFIAQDVEKIFPDIVYTNDQGIKGIALAELIPVIVEALKEHDEQIIALKKEIEKISSKSNTKSASINQNSTNVFETANLSQNIPNPFSESTKINMFLPSEIVSAIIYLYNMQGVQINKFTIHERGATSVTIEGFTLDAGMYLYTLIADGKEVDTKKMILTK
jgi:hypothetical protein